jgi:diguanylate cyclase (GGDEF)-like protein
MESQFRADPVVPKNHQEYPTKGTGWMLDGHLVDQCSAEQLPSLSNVALEILRISRDEQASMDDLAKVIKTDPALTVKMLKTVNSSLFKLNREISSIKDAVNMLGMRSVRMLALSFSLADSAKGNSGDAFDFEAYWRRSLSHAVVARLIAQASAPKLSEEAFVSGLLADLGSVAAWRCAPKLYNEVIDEWQLHKRSLQVIEQEKLGVHHAALSGKLLKQWGLPESLCEAVRSHHGGRDAGDSVLDHVVRAAADIADLFCREKNPAELEAVKAGVILLTGLTTDKLEEILGQLDENVQEIASMLSVQVGETVDYGRLQVEAAQHLVQLSMMADVDRRASSRREAEARLEAERLQNENLAILETASTDGLTKLANRAAFDKRLAEEIENAYTDDHPLGLIMLDVDHFKNFNDTHGHRAGDEVLRSVGAIMKDVVKGLGFAARYGGEEFVVIAPGRDDEGLREIAENLRQEIEERTVKFEGKNLKVTVSLGGVSRKLKSDTKECSALVEGADRNLYKAKNLGRNRVELG